MSLLSVVALNAVGIVATIGAGATAAVPYPSPRITVLTKPLNTRNNRRRSMSKKPLTREEAEAIARNFDPWECHVLAQACRKRSTAHHDYTCKDCQQHHSMFVVRDDLWKKVFGAGRGHLCLPCFEKRLGRPVQLTDLKDVRANDSLVHVLQRQEAPRVEKVP